VLTLDSMPISPKIPVQCECGQTVNKGWLLSHHRAGVYHRHYKLIQSMLKDDSHSFTEIGNRVGVSREYIRQIAEKLGAAKGRERQALHTTNRIWKKWAEREDVRFLRAKGLEVRPVMSSCKYHRPLQKFLRVNGHLVKFGQSKHHRRARDRKYIVIPNRYGTVKVDFYLLKNADIWMVIPRAKYPMLGTSFSVNPDPRYGTYTRLGRPARHDYLDYVEAWHLLKVRKRGTRP
jgi:hypothetical protein